MENLDRSAKALGGTTVQDGIEKARFLLARLTELFDKVKTPELMRKELDAFQVTPLAENLLVQIAGAGPLLLRWLASKVNQSAESSLPAIPNRRPAVAGKIQAEIVRFVNDLNFRHGADLKTAMRRASQRFGCSYRTVERFWAQRTEILANGPNYHFLDLMQELSTVLEEDLGGMSPITALAEEGRNQMERD